MKKFLIVFLFLCVLCGVGFFFGWMNLYVPADSYGVMQTKTSGTDQALIGPGSGLVWRWENLIPTNVNLQVFSAKPHSVTVTDKGTLPSGDVYSKAVPNEPDFSYEVSFTANIRFKPESLVSLVASGEVSADTLSAWYDKKADELKTKVMGILSRVAESGDAEDMAAGQALSGAILSTLKDSVTDMEVLSIAPSGNMKLPDPRIYARARQNYELFTEEFRNAEIAQMRRARTLYGDDDIAFQREVKQLEEYALLIEKYPVLLKYLYIRRQPEAAKKEIPEIRDLFGAPPAGQE